MGLVLDWHTLFKNDKANREPCQLRTIQIDKKMFGEPGLKIIKLINKMSRYTEYLKEKVLCKVCNKVISKGQREAHIKRKIHIKNVEKFYNGKIDKNSEVEKSIKKI